MGRYDQPRAAAGVPGAVNGLIRVFVKDAKTDAITTVVEVSLLLLLLLSPYHHLRPLDCETMLQM